MGVVRKKVPSRALEEKKRAEAGCDSPVAALAVAAEPAAAAAAAGPAGAAGPAAAAEPGSPSADRQTGQETQYGRHTTRQEARGRKTPKSTAKQDRRKPTAKRFSHAQAVLERLMSACCAYLAARTLTDQSNQWTPHPEEFCTPCTFCESCMVGRRQTSRPASPRTGQ